MAVNRVPPELLEEILILQVQGSDDATKWNLGSRRVREMQNSMLVRKSWLGPATRILYRVVHLAMLNIHPITISLHNLSIFGMHVRELHIFIPVTNGVATKHVPKEEQCLEGTLDALANCPNTRSVAISYFRCADNLLLQCLIAGLETLSSLESLELCMPPGVLSSDNVCQILHRVRNLKKVTFDPVGPSRITYPPFHSRTLRAATLSLLGVANDTLFDLMSLFQGVQVLHLRAFECDQVTKHGISRALAHLAKSIEELSLDWSDAWLDVTNETCQPLQHILPEFTRLKKLKIICSKVSFFDAGVFSVLPTTLRHFEARIYALTSAELVSWLSSYPPPFAADLTLDIDLDDTKFGDGVDLKALCAERGYTCDLRWQPYPPFLHLHLATRSS